MRPGPCSERMLLSSADDARYAGVERVPAHLQAPFARAIDGLVGFAKA